MLAENPVTQVLSENHSLRLPILLHSLYAHMALARYADTATVRCGTVVSGFSLEHLNLSKNDKNANVGNLLKIITILTVVCLIVR